MAAAGAGPVLIVWQKKTSGQADRDWLCWANGQLGKKNSSGHNREKNFPVALGSPSASRWSHPLRALKQRAENKNPDLEQPRKIVSRCGSVTQLHKAAQSPHCCSQHAQLLTATLQQFLTAGMFPGNKEPDNKEQF